MITVKLQATATDKHGRTQPIEIEVQVNSLFGDTNQEGKKVVCGDCSIGAYGDANFEFVPEEGFEAFAR